MRLLANSSAAAELLLPSVNSWQRPAASGTTTAAAALLAAGAVALLLLLLPLLLLLLPRWRRGQEAGGRQQLRSESAPISRSCSGAELTGSYGSAEQLQRVPLRRQPPAADAGVAGRPGNATISFGTKLDAVAGVALVMDPRVTFTAKPQQQQQQEQHQQQQHQQQHQQHHQQQQQWQLVLVDIRCCDSSDEEWQQLDRVAADVAPRQRDAATLQSATAASATPVRLQLQRQQRLLISATAVSANRSVCLGHVIFPTDQINEPVMSFSVAMAMEPREWRRSWQPQVQVWLQYQPGQQVSEMRVQLLRADQLPPVAKATASVVATLTATVGGEASGRVSLQAAAVGSWCSFEQTVDLPLDNRQLGASGLTVALAALDTAGACEPRPLGCVRFGDFAVANGAAMHHWQLAIAHPNTWICLAHCCRL